MRQRRRGAVWIRGALVPQQKMLQPGGRRVCFKGQMLSIQIQRKRRHMQQRRLNLPVRPRPVQQPPRETPQTCAQNPPPAPKKELTRLY